LLKFLRHIIVGTIDFCHRPFARWIPNQTFRYLACGGSNTVLNIAIFSLTLRFLFTTEKVHIFGDINVAADVAAYVVAFCISFPIGFTLSRHIVFPESNLHGRIQFFRYVLTTATFILLTYLLIKSFDILLSLVIPNSNASYALLHSITYTLITIITAILSYISQRRFTFKSVEEGVIEDDITEDDAVPD
jgi:putative flippase GtrA